MEGNSECHICYEHKTDKLFKTLVCNHKLCFNCYNKLIQSTCPFCRHPIEIPNPSVYIAPDIPFSIEDTYITQDNYTNNHQPFSRVRRNMKRRRRRNLSFDEVLKKRRRIKKRCKQKWMRKNGRLRKILHGDKYF
tara:strand:+ start:349 stop:753 length:405 start_codon:yes stop_codon:yes gene_type:complete